MRLFRYRLPLVDPFVVDGHSLNIREGLLLHAPERGDAAWAEASPLPGWSRESLDEVIEAARSGNWSACSSLEFAYQVLYDDTLPSDAQISLNGLLQGEASVVRTQAEHFACTSIGTLKLKVGNHPSLEAEVDFVREVMDRLRPDQRLRLDANRRWDWDDAVAFGKEIHRHSSTIEYVEEPLRDPKQLEAWREATGLNYALDETLRESPDLREFAHATAFIIKPTLQGYSRQAFERLAEYDVPMVISGCYESGIGLYQLARLAARWSPGMAHGLDTYRRLERDVLRTRWDMADGQLRPRPSFVVAMELLEEIV